MNDNTLILEARSNEKDLLEIITDLSDSQINILMSNST